MTKEQLIDRHAQTLKSLVGTGLAKDECVGLIKNAVDEALFLYGVVGQSEQFSLADVYKLAQGYTEEQFIEMINYLQG